jgi:SAM-dependent methyltransferase
VLALDLGCGNTLHRPICEAAGFDYVGLDYAAPEAPILGDAHALPFKNDSFEFILSIAVLEHIQYPFVMVNEVFRVLKPGGKFIGTVAFLEPFHGDSYYHHSHLGTYNMLRFAGFKVDVVAPSAEWSVLEAQASMGLFPRMPRFLSHALVKPIKFASRCWWWLAGVLGREANLQKLTLNTTGAFSFVATKVQ